MRARADRNGGLARIDVAGLELQELQDPQRTGACPYSSGLVRSLRSWWPIPGRRWQVPGYFTSECCRSAASAFAGFDAKPTHFSKDRSEINHQSGSSRFGVTEHDCHALRLSISALERVLVLDGDGPLGRRAGAYLLEEPLQIWQLAPGIFAENESGSSAPSPIPPCRRCCSQNRPCTSRSARWVFRMAKWRLASNT